MSAPREIIPGCRITLHLRLQLEDGTVALDTVEDAEPLTITLGDGTLRPGIELALYGLAVGDTQTLTLTPAQAYGASDPDLIHEVPLSDFPTELQPEPGQIIAFTAPNGQETPGAVMAIKGDHARVDFNHPLAGHALEVWCEILAIEAPRLDIGG